MDRHDFAILTHITNPTLFNKVASELLSQPCKPSSFDLLEFQLQHQAKLQEIRSSPIVLKLGLYECSFDAEGIHYFKWTKKQRGYIKVSGGNDCKYLFGGKGNQLIAIAKEPMYYMDENGHWFSEPNYWDKEEMTREEWLKGESIC